MAKIPVTIRLPKGQFDCPFEFWFRTFFKFFSVDNKFIVADNCPRLNMDKYYKFTK